ncbi:MAG: TauD/TfdA family dioxygenase [Parvibaculaceae bacterium]|nr:TauD/TfdA family dioxygenase [Parvibaculaceae bacterium]
MSQEGFRSFGEQALHYFDRPHTRVPTGPIDSPAAWLAKIMPPLSTLAYSLTATDVAELEQALKVAQKSPKNRKDLLAEDFPLPHLSAKFASWRRELSKGLGIQIIRGVPVDTWTQDEVELFFWCFGLHLGRPGAQNPEEHLLGHVTNTNADKADPMVRLYQTAANIDYHCDAADVVGLLCLRKAKSGGKSRIVSSVSVFNELMKRRPELVSRLFEPFFLDSRNENNAAESGCLPIPPCRYSEGVLRTFYHADYFRSAQRHADVPPFTEQEQDLLDTYEAIAAEKGIYMDMDLQPGDIQLLSNHTNLHARTEYEDHEDIGERRHLLRLWLSL